MSPDQQIDDWVQNFVIAHNLCPFAARPYFEGRVEIITQTSADIEACFTWALAQVEGFVNTRAVRVETSLLVFPAALPDFLTFLDFVATFEDALEQTGAIELVQLAHFHPDYLFEGLETDDPANLTNRAPHPVLQLLRTDSVARAIEEYPDVGAIPQRNIDYLRKHFPKA